MNPTPYQVIATPWKEFWWRKVRVIAVGIQTGNKYNINSFVGQYLKYFVLNKRIALAGSGNTFCFGQNISTY